MTRIFPTAIAFCLLFLSAACDKKPAAGPAATATQPAAAAAAAPTPAPAGPPLKIAYSDWPGWVAWDIAVQKGWFKDAGVNVEFVWLEYDPSMKAFAADKVDAVCMTNGDAMVTGSGGKASTLVVLNDYSNGNDMIIAKPGIESVKDLKGKKVGVELTLVDHLLLLKALEANGMDERSVTLVGIATDKLAQALAASTEVDAIAAWQPNSGQALKQVPGSKAIFTSKDVPGLIYDGLYVNRESLGARAAEWQKVVNVWFKVVAYIKDPATRPDAVKVMAARVQIPPEEYAKLMDGTFFLDKPGNLKALAKGAGYDSVYGSSDTVNKFNVAKGVYKEPADVNSYVETRMVKAAK